MAAPARAPSPGSAPSRAGVLTVGVAVASLVPALGCSSAALPAPTLAGVASVTSVTDPMGADPVGAHPGGAGHGGVALGGAGPWEAVDAAVAEAGASFDPLVAVVSVQDAGPWRVYELRDGLDRPGRLEARRAGDGTIEIRLRLFRFGDEAAERRFLARLRRSIER